MKKDGHQGSQGKSKDKDRPERRPSITQRMQQTPEQGYDEEKEAGEIGYSEPGKRKAQYSREEQLKRAQSRAREEARRFWSFFDRLPGLWDELPEDEKEVIKAKFAYIEPVTPPPALPGQAAKPTVLRVSTSGKRRKRTHAQVISDLADEYERRQDRTMAESWIPRKGRRRKRFMAELTVEMERRAAARRKSYGEMAAKEWEKARNKEKGKK